MRITLHGNIPAELAEEIQGDVSEQQNLGDMMKWAMTHPAGIFDPKVVSEVIIQDEFTHDVIVPRNDGLVLVYDTT